MDQSFPSGRRVGGGGGGGEGHFPKRLFNPSDRKVSDKVARNVVKMTHSQFGKFGADLTPPPHRKFCSVLCNNYCLSYG